MGAVKLDLIKLFCECTRKGETMNPEIFNAAVLCFTLILVGLGLGFLLLKIQGGEEEA
jgi:cytochrome b6-f complex subunit 7